jgi:hypothetical protein
MNGSALPGVEALPVPPESEPQVEANSGAENGAAENGSASQGGAA